MGNFSLDNLPTCSVGLIQLNKNSYPERWRDWPYETRQPDNVTVLTPAEEILEDESRVKAIPLPAWEEFFRLQPKEAG